MNWKTALDVQMDMHKWHSSEYGLGYTLGFFEDFLRAKTPEEVGYKFGIDRARDAAKLTTNLVRTLWRADTMYVTTEMQHLLLQAAHDLPSEAEFSIENLITPMGFCQLEETIYGEDSHGLVVAISAFAWHVAPVKTYYDTDTGEELHYDEPMQVIAIYFFTPTDDDLDHINRTVLPEMRERGIPIPPFALCHFFPGLEGRTVPSFENKPGAELIVGLLKFFMAMHYVGHQPIGEPIKMPLDRHARRRFARYAPDEPERRITLITLRRKSVKKDDHEPQKVEWSRRWVVRGFWRKQWYPKSKTHDWKYIHEYIKGPKDKPLVITERRVFNFRR